MIGHKSPPKTGRGCLHQNAAEAFDKLPPVRIIPEDIAALDPATYDMVQCAGSVYAGLAGHDPFITYFPLQ